MEIAPPTASKRVGDYLVVKEDGSIFKVYSQRDRNNWLAHPVNLLPYRPGMGPALPWDMVGIHRYNGVQRNTTINIS